MGTVTPQSERPAAEAAEKAAVCVIGLGHMGSALARVFLCAEHAVTVWNRSEARTGPLVAAGAMAAASPAEAVAAGALVLVCVTDAEAATEILESAGAALRGRVVVNLTSGSSAQARAAARFVADHGGEYLAGAVQGTPDMIGGAGTVVLHAGSARAFETHGAALRTLSGTAAYLGPDPGAVAVYDLALLHMMLAGLNSFLHGAALVGTEEVPAAALAPIAEGVFASMGPMIRRYAEQADSGEYPAEDATLETFLAGATHLRNETAERGVDHGLPDHLVRVLEALCARGHGGDSYGRVLEYYRPAPAV